MERPAERPVPRRLIELSHQIRHGMVTYPGLPGPELSDYLPRSASPARHGPGTEFHIGPISMVANTGTCLDSPFHRVAGHRPGHLQRAGPPHRWHRRAPGRAARPGRPRGTGGGGVSS